MRAPRSEVRALRRTLRLQSQILSFIRVLWARRLDVPWMRLPAPRPLPPGKGQRRRPEPGWLPRERSGSCRSCPLRRPCCQLLGLQVGVSICMCPLESGAVSPGFGLIASSLRLEAGRERETQHVAEPLCAGLAAAACDGLHVALVIDLRTSQQNARGVSRGARVRAAKEGNEFLLSLLLAVLCC